MNIWCSLICSTLTLTSFGLCFDQRMLRMKKLLAKSNAQEIENRKKCESEPINLESLLSLDQISQGIDYYSSNEVPK